MKTPPEVRIVSAKTMVAIAEKILMLCETATLDPGSDIIGFLGMNDV